MTTKPGNLAVCLAEMDRVESDDRHAAAFWHEVNRAESADLHEFRVSVIEADRVTLERHAERHGICDWCSGAVGAPRKWPCPDAKTVLNRWKPAGTGGAVGGSKATRGAVG